MCICNKYIHILSLSGEDCLSHVNICLTGCTLFPLRKKNNINKIISYIECFLQESKTNTSYKILPGDVFF